MQAELRQFIEQERFYKAAVLRLGDMLPPDDAALDELIAETVQSAIQKEFIFIVVAALASGRKVSVRHLARGAMMMPNWNVLGWVAWQMDGELPEPLLEAVQQTQLARDQEAVALFVIAAWCQQHRGGTLPDGVLSAARALTRHKTEESYEALKVATLRSLAALTGDKALASVIVQQHGAPDEAAVKDFIEILLKSFKQDSMTGFLPDAPVNTLATGTTMRRAVPRTGRNEPCPCGSGKKYKHCCHGKDQERLHHSSEVAGRTREELEANPEQHLTQARLDKTPSHELGRFDPRKVPEDLVVQYFMRLAGLSLFDRAAEAFEQLGYVEELKEVWRFVLFFATRKGRKDVAERMLKWRPDAAQIETELETSTRLLLAQDDAGRFLKLLEDLALEALQTEDSQALEKFAYGVISSQKLKALGIFVSRSMLPLVQRQEASFLFERILETRDKLNLSPDDPFGDILDQRFADSAADESKDAAALRKAQRSLDAKTAEVQQLKESQDRLQREIARREKPTSPVLQAVTVPPTDDLPLQELREKLESLKTTLKERHGERNELRRELQKTHADLETLRQKSAPITESIKAENDADPEEDLLLPQEAANGNQPVRLIEFPRNFQQTLAGVPRHVARGALSALGRLAGGEAAAFVGAVRLKACPAISRQRIGIDHRLLFRLLPDRVQVVDLIPRQDLERRIKTLV